MDAGLEVTNNDSFLQIDSRYSNLSYVGKTTATVEAAANYGQVYRLSQAVDIVVMVELTVGKPVALVSCSQSGSTRSYIFHTGTVPAGSTLTFYLFKKQQPLGITYGLEVYNASGALVFAGPGRYMRVAAHLAYSDYRTQPAKPLPSGRQYAVMIGRVSGQITVSYVDVPSNPERSEIRSAPYFSFSGSSVTTYDSDYFSMFFTGGITPWDRTNYNLSAIIADVTGF